MPELKGDPDAEFKVDEATKTVSTHYSALTLHRECPQAFMYRYDLGLRRHEVGPKPELEFGSWWSAIRAAESLERGRKLESLRGRPDSMSPVDGAPEFDKKTVTVSDIFKAAEVWWERVARVPENVAVWSERLETENLPDMLRTAFARWTREYADEREDEAPMAVEMFWERKMPSREAGQPEVRLYGFIDEVYKDRRRNLVVVRDQKTSKQLDATTAFDDMMDSQLMLYAWGASPMIGAWGDGPVRMIQYDRMRSIQPKPPHLTLSGNLAVRNGQPSVSSCDLETYLEWAAGPDGEGVPWGEQGVYYVSGNRKGEPKFGFYTAEDNVVEKLSTPAARSSWFNRKTVPLNINVVRTHLRAAVDSAEDIQRTQKRVSEVSEAQRNLSRSNCRWCDAVGLCRAQMMGGPTGDYELADYNLIGRDGLTRLSGGVAVK